MDGDHSFDAKGFEAFGAVFGFVLDGFAVLESVEAFAFDHRVVDENVFGVFIVGDEAETFLVVEPFDLACGHGSHSFRDVTSG